MQYHFQTHLSSWIITACKRSLGQGNIFRSVCPEFCSQGRGWYPSMHCRWYPSMPCRYPGGWYPSMPCRSQGPHLRWKLGDLARGSPGQHRWGVSQHALRQTPCRHTQMATAAGGMHPTGMHSCFCHFSNIKHVPSPNKG